MYPIRVWHSPCRGQTASQVYGTSHIGRMYVSPHRRGQTNEDMNRIGPPAHSAYSYTSKPSLIFALCSSKDPTIS